MYPIWVCRLSKLKSRIVKFPLGPKINGPVVVTLVMGRVDLLRAQERSILMSRKSDK